MMDVLTSRCLIENGDGRMNITDGRFTDIRMELKRINSEIEKASVKLDDAKIFRPKYAGLMQFMLFNGDSDGGSDETGEDETVIVEEQGIKINKFRTNLEGFLPIVAVDTSSKILGETEQGIVAAYRSTIVVLSDLHEKPHAFRFGPYVFHLTEENKLGIYNHFRKLLGLDKVSESEVPKLLKLADRIRNAIERMLQKAAAKIIRNGIVLWDGSLIGGTVDTPIKIVKENISLAHSNGNSVVGVSKKSRLRTTSGKKLINLLENVYEACYVDVHKIIVSRQLGRYLGHVFAVKFSPFGFTFRVDVAPRSGLTPIQALEQLVSSCKMYNGYPELLRDAHITARLTSIEVLALQAYIAREYGLTILKSFNIRKYILFPFW